jgi:hypothetical protein
MSAHSKPWHRDSLFGDGPRRPLDREQRARFRYLLNAHRRARRLTPLTEIVGNALVRRLGVDGQCDPSHDTLAADAGCCSRTVRRALAAMRALGLVLWQCRLVRVGTRVIQSSNAYALALTEMRTLPTPRPGGQAVRETKREDIKPVQQASAAEVRAAQNALADRRRVMEGRLLTKAGL